MKFKSKIVTIEAYQILDDTDVVERPTPKWITTNMIERKIILVEADGGFSVLSREGWVKGKVGDWIIKGLEDEIYICKASVFKAKYEPIE